MGTRLEGRDFVSPADLGIVQSKAIASLFAIDHRLGMASSQHCSDGYPIRLLPDCMGLKLTIAIAMS